MRSKTESRVFGLMAGGCLLAAGVAQAQITIVTPDKKPAHAAIPFYKYVGPNKIVKFWVGPDSASGRLNQTVPIAAYALVDEGSCALAGIPRGWRVPEFDKKGNWSGDVIWATLGDGACPGKLFPFDRISFTWRNSLARVGTTDADDVQRFITDDVPKSPHTKKGNKYLDTLVGLDRITFTYTGP